MDKAGARLLMALALMSARLHADLAGAKTAYARGVEKEQARSYSAAMVEYQNALLEDPDYVYAHRELGNCLFYSGDKKAALYEYRLYLASRPDDEAVRVFAEKLEPSLAARKKAPEVTLKDSFYAGISVGEAATVSDDMQQFVPGTVIQDTTAILALLKLGFLSESGFWLEGAYSYGPYRQYPILYSSVSSSFSFKDTYTFVETTFSIEPGFRVKIGRRVTLGAGIAAGYSTDTMTYSSTIFPTQTFSGGNISYSPELRCGLIFGQIGVDIDLGYHISKSGTMKDSSGAPLVLTNYVTGNPETWNMDNSGVFLRVGAVYYFSPPFAP